MPLGLHLCGSGLPMTPLWLIGCEEPGMYPLLLKRSARDGWIGRVVLATHRSPQI